MFDIDDVYSIIREADAANTKQRPSGRLRLVIVSIPCCYMGAVQIRRRLSYLNNPDW